MTVVSPPMVLTAPKTYFALYVRCLNLFTYNSLLLKASPQRTVPGKGAAFRAMILILNTETTTERAR